MRDSLQTGARNIFIAVVLVALPATGASAQGVFDFLFGRPPERPAPAAPSLQPQLLPPRSSQPSQNSPAPGNVDQPISNSSTGRGAAYCVRMCDGRYFPLERHATATTSQLCSSFCPASPTKVYNGGAIALAVAADGSRYADLKTAYLYRKSIVLDCTCNGRDVFGLATIDVKTDPTLRAGDTVSTADGVIVVARPAESSTAPASFGPAARPVTRN
jgi:hypothetical protein